MGSRLSRSLTPFNFFSMIQKYKARIWLQWVAIVVPVLVAPILLFPRREWMVLGLAVPAVWVGNYWLKKRFLLQRRLTFCFSLYS